MPKCRLPPWMRNMTPPPVHCCCSKDPVGKCSRGSYHYKKTNWNSLLVSMFLAQHLQLLSNEYKCWLDFSVRSKCNNSISPRLIYPNTPRTLLQPHYMSRTIIHFSRSRLLVYFDCQHRRKFHHYSHRESYNCSWTKPYFGNPVGCLN